MRPNCHIVLKLFACSVICVLAIGLGTGCRQALVGAESDSPVPPSEPGQTKAEHAKQALAMGRDFRKKKDLETATYYYLNAINACPNDAAILLEYGTLVEAIAGSKADPLEAADVLQRAAALFRGQALHVNPEQIAPLLKKADDYDKAAREKLAAVREKPGPGEAATPDSAPPDGGIKAKYQDLLSSLALGSPPDLPDKESEVRSQRQEMDRLLEFAERLTEPEDRDREAIKWLRGRLATLDALERFNAARLMLEELLGHAREEQDPTEASMVLQQVEAIVRDVVLVKPALPQSQQAQVKKWLEDLKGFSDKVAQREADRRSKELWERFVQHDKHYSTLLGGIERWQAPSTTDPAETGKEGECTKRLRQIEELSRRVQSVALQVRGDEQEAAFGALDKLTRHAEQVSQARRNCYCQWALKMIRKSLEGYEKNTGVFDDDEVGFEDALVENLGPIDVALLTYEVQRCYQEAFETIFGQLGKAKAKDLEKPGTKLNTIRRIAETKRLDMSAF